jgi:hypothetical protein
MEIWFRCSNCGTDTQELCCPACGNDELFEVEHCSFCEMNYDYEEVHPKVYFDICENCLRELFKDLNISFEYINSDKQLMIDFYIKWMFNCTADLDPINSGIELIKLCEKTYKKSVLLPKERNELLAKLNDFIMQNPDDFAEWFANRRTSKVSKEGKASHQIIGKEHKMSQ